MWEYAVLYRLGFNIGLGEYHTLSVNPRWVLTTKISDDVFDGRNHPEYAKLFEQWRNAVSQKKPNQNEIQQKVKAELMRIIENNELPHVIITGSEREDDLDLIRKASELNWETTGRTPGSNLVMMRRRID